MPGRATPTAISPRPDAADATRDLYSRHGQRVYSFCASRLGSAEEAQDAAQTTFVYVLSALKRGVVPRNELAWLLTIADNVCRSTRRSNGRRLARVANADVDELEAAATSISVETHQTLDDLRGALEELPLNQRRAILLREWQGLSYADIADQLGLTVAAVETLLFRARRGLATRLERRRARLRALDLGSVFAFLRSLLGGAVGKLAIGLAGVAIVAALPGVGPEAPAVVAEPSPSVVSAASLAPDRVTSVAQDAARVVRSPARATRARRVSARTGRRHSARPVVRSAVAPPAQAPSAAAPPAAAPAGRPSPPSVPVPATVPPAVPAPPPVDVHAAASTVVTTATGTVGAVVSTVATVVPPLPRAVKVGP